MFYSFIGWPTFLTKTPLKDNGYGIVNFIGLYLFGAYINIYKEDFERIKKYSIPLYILFSIITTVYSYFSSNAWDYSSVFNLFGSVFLFWTFDNIKMNYNSVINYLSQHTLDIFLIHGTYLFYDILYKNLFHCDKYYNDSKMIINLIITTFGIYLICLIISIIRKLILGKIIDNNINKIKCEIEVD